MGSPYDRLLPEISSSMPMFYFIIGFEDDISGSSLS
jgi:hypothetical protein